MSMTANLLKVSEEKLAELQSDPALVSALVMDVIEGNVAADDCLDLYKSWNALDVLLNDGEPGAEADAVLGGTTIGEDLGYGPARMLDQNEVAQISTALAKVTQSEFESRFDVGKMEDVYSFHPEDAEDEWPIISDLFEELQKFYATASDQSYGMILYIV
ncbi:YfbM family protein [bacterium]|nr:YfbM family protein [bacterium]